MRIDELTFFRFIAAAIVVNFHLFDNALLPGTILVTGPQMVTFFFVLSGFVLTISYFDKDINKVQFWWARAARIMPAYFLALFLTMIVGMAGRKIEPLGLFLNLTFLQSWISPYPLSMNSPSWSLSVEAFFYAVFPLILIVIKKCNLSAKPVMILAFSTWLVTQIILTYFVTAGYGNSMPSLSHDLIYYFPLSHICSFLIGISAAMWFKNKPRVINSNLISLLLVGGTILLTIFILNDMRRLDRFLGLSLAHGSSLFAPLFFVLVLIIAICRSKLVKILSAKPLLLLGEASYSLYILQYPIKQIWDYHLTVRFSLSPVHQALGYFIFLVVVSIFTFLFFEKPLNKFLRYKLPPLFRKCFSNSNSPPE